VPARHAAAILEKKLPPDDPRRLEAMWLMGNSLPSEGAIEQGKRLLEEGLRVIEASRKPDDRLRIWFLNDLGVAAIGNGRLDDARRYFERALEVRERVYPDELHPERISGLNNLAYVLILQGDTARARPLVEQSLRNSERVHGAEHVLTANVVGSLAELDRREGKLVEARALAERALAIYEHNGLRRAPFVVSFLLTLAEVDEAENRLPAAERRLREAIEIATGQEGYDTPTQLDATDALAKVLRRAGRTAEADALDSRAAEIRRKSGQASSLPIGANIPQSRSDEKRP
jgi:tetratricopeptide (TPR) repeat protein